MKIDRLNLNILEWIEDDLENKRTKLHKVLKSMPTQPLELYLEKKENSPVFDLLFPGLPDLMIDLIDLHLIKTNDQFLNF